MGSRERRSGAWGVGAWALGMLVGFWPTLLHGASLGDPGDTRFVGYVLEHGWRALLGRTELLDPPFFFPERGVGAWSELTLPLLALYAPFRALGAGPHLAAQLWLLTLATLNAAAAWRFTRRLLGAEPFVAAVATFLIAFGSPRLAQLNHQHLFAAFLSLLAIEGAVRWLRPATARPGPWLLVAAVAAGLQFAAGLYLAFFLFLAGLVALAALLSLAEGRALLVAALRRSGAWPWGAALAAGALVAPLAAVYLRAGVAHDFAVVRGYVPELHSWLHLGPQSWLYGWTSDLALFQRLPSEGEHRVGVGLVTLALAGFGLLSARKTLAGRVLGVTVLVLLVVALRWRGGWTPWALVYAGVPGAKGLRVVARLGVFMLIPWGAAVAWGLGAVRRRWLAFSLGALVVAEQLRTPIAWQPSALPSVEVPRGCRAFYLAAPATEAWPFEYVQLDAMWAALEAGVPTVNGYSGREPTGWPLEDVRDWERRHGLAPGTVCVVAPRGAPAPPPAGL